MDIQKRLLRIMLWMLGLSAAAGVLAVFLSTRIMGRVAGTALIAAITIAAAMPVSRMLDDPKQRSGGMVGLWGIVLGFLFALSAVWVGVIATSWDIEARLAATAAIFAIGGTLAGFQIVKLSVPWAKWSALTALPINAIAMSLFLFALWGEEQEPAMSSVFLLASGAAASFALIGLGLERRPWRWLGVLGAAIGLALGLIGTWFDTSEDPTGYTASMSLAVAVAYAIVVLRIPLGESRFWILFAAIGSTAATGCCLTLNAVITDGFKVPGPDMISRLTGALGIVSACSSLALVVMYRLNRKPPGTSAVITEIKTVQVVCPHCGRRNATPIGESACNACGLILTIGVREPRCIKCDYSLLDLKVQACPECGTPRAASLPFNAIA